MRCSALTWPITGSTAGAASHLAADRLGDAAHLMASTALANSASTLSPIILAAVRGDPGFHDLPLLAPRIERADLIRSHEAAIALDVNRENGGQPAFSIKRFVQNSASGPCRQPFAGPTARKPLRSRLRCDRSAKTGDVRVGSKPEELAASICLPLFTQERTFGSATLPAANLVADRNRSSNCHGLAFNYGASAVPWISHPPPACSTIGDRGLQNCADECGVSVWPM